MFFCTGTKQVSEKQNIPGDLYLFLICCIYCGKLLSLSFISAAKRMKKQVFVSNNIVSAPGMLNMPLIEQRIIKELTEFPDKFGY